MAYHDDEEDKKDSTVSEEALGEVLDEDADEEDDLVSGAVLDDEKVWE